VLGSLESHEVKKCEKKKFIRSWAGEGPWGAPHKEVPNTPGPRDKGGRKVGRITRKTIAGGSRGGGFGIWQKMVSGKK